MALEYKITYFPSEALCEPIRWLFAYAGIEYEDFRFERENWLKIKPNMPFGQVPILEHNGKVAHQNLAIARYLAKKSKLIGNNDWEDLEIDAIVDTINDLRTNEMAPAYKLTYFPVEALGEPIRWLFSYAGIEFDDSRFQAENWPKIKPNTPFGQVPILEYNGKMGHQSIAIARYAAKKAKLVGNDDWEDLEIDAVIDTINDLRQKLALYHYEADPAIKETRKEPLFKETLPFYLQRLDAIVKKNNGHLAVGRLTWADIFFAAISNYFIVMSGGKAIFANYPNLVALLKEVTAIPSIKAWIDKRPSSA